MAQPSSTTQGSYDTLLLKCGSPFSHILLFNSEGSRPSLSHPGRPLSGGMPRKHWGMANAGSSVQLSELVQQQVGAFRNRIKEERHI